MSEHDYLLGPKPARPLHAIAAEICAAHNVRPADFFSNRRIRQYAWARQEYCYRARQETSASYPEIAALLKWDHTSAMYAVWRYEQRLASNS